ncbi:glycosyltransferase [Shimia sp.]|uniref:glycosyltransferase n=1 Tax=Shimia sp. TaxID=1954381 RepID=UPI00329936DE
MDIGTTEQTGSNGRLVAVVVTYNRLDKLQTTLTRLLENAPAHLQAVVLVDNASTDGTEAWLATRADPRLVVERLAVNSGGAGGFRHGLRAAQERFDPDWFVVMDDDAHPAPEALATFHAVLRRDDTAAAAAVYFPDGRICEMNRPSVNPFWRPRVFARTVLRGLRGKGRDGYHIPYASYEDISPLEIDLTSFVGLFLSRRMLIENGLPDSRLFLYGDDVIYTLRLRRSGFVILFEPGLRFEHDCSTFENDQRRVFSPIWKVYYSYRNGLIMYREASGLLLFWPLAAMAAVKWALAGRRYGAQRRCYNRLLRRALVDGLRGRATLKHQDVLALAAADKEVMDKTCE